MPLLKVRVGDLVLKRPVSWNLLMVVKEELKKYARWEPLSKEWIIEPSRLSSASKQELLDLLTKAFPTTDMTFVEQELDRLMDAAKTIVIRAEESKIVVSPPRLRQDLWRDLMEATSIPYYIQTSDFDLKLTKIRLLKYDRFSRTLEGPPAVLPMLITWARKHNFKIRINGDLPSPQKIEIPKDTVQLLPFQKRALDAWLAKKRGTIVIPTGGGKTYIGLKALAKLSVRTLICVTTVELAKQWRERLRKHLGIEAGMLGGGEMSLGTVTVAIYNSAAKYVDRLARRFDFIIFDEGHHVPAETFKEVALKMWAPYRMVLSATPERYDKNELLIYTVCGEPVFKITYPELARMGVVAPLIFKRFYVELTPDEWKLYNDAWMRYKAGQLAYLQRAKQIALCASRKYEVLAKLVQQHPSEKILVFCQYIPQAEEAYRVVKQIESKTALVTGSTGNDLRRRIFDMFRSGQLRILVTTTVLDEGIDVPDADVAIIMSGSGTKRQMIQRVGRVVRWRPGKIAKVYEIVAGGTIDETLAHRRDIRKDFSLKEMVTLIKASRYAMQHPTVRKLFQLFLAWREGRVQFSDEDLHELVSLIEETVRRLEEAVR